MSAASGRGPVLDANFVARALGEALRERSGPEGPFRRAVIDSRRVEAGDLFVALRGERADGHDFAADAAARGAAGLLLERPPEGDLPGDPAVFVAADALAGLQRLAAAWREALEGLEVIGVTGNVGKTTTKLIASAVLERRYRVRSSALNYNNEIGVPLCLLELDPGIERTVIEHGMYTTGEIAQLCAWTRPRVGVVLNVGPVHLERAGSLEAIARAKRELVEALPDDGYALLNADDPVVAAMAEHTAARVLRFGTAEDAAVRGSELASHGAGGFSFTLEAGGERRRVHAPLPGAHLLPNVLAAAAVGLVEGVPFAEIVGALEALDVPLRLTVRCLPGGVTLLDDTYNASPAATRAALDLLGEMPGRRIALLGDMLELGELAEPSHEQVGRHAADRADALLTVGDLAATIARGAREAGLGDVRTLGSKAEAAAVLRALLRPGDALLVKGSRALALETVVEELEALLAGRPGEAASGGGGS